MPPRRRKRMEMSARKNSDQPGQTLTPCTNKEAYGPKHDGLSGSATEATGSTLAAPPDASIPTAVPSVHNKIEYTQKMETIQVDTDTERDSMHSSDFRNTCSYRSFQEKLSDVFTSLQTLVRSPGFRNYIEEEVNMSDLGDINRELRSRKNDLMKTDCPVVIAGETSAGKSSVINLIIGEDILATDITATTSRICRLRYSEKLQISTCDSEDREIHVTEFDDREHLAETLSELTTTEDDETKYIDVWIPLEILKDNVVIVDTPGIGDQVQDKLANRMMKYIPNALAFVFVVDMGSAGGLQGDRLLRILERVKGSLNQMHSFDPKDAIFLLNKWDTLILKNRKRDLYEETKMKLRNIWEEVQDQNILKFSAARVDDNEVYKREFDHFQQILKSIIAKNENKRIKVHLKFIRTFIENCDVAVTGKLNFARQSKEENSQTFQRLKRELEDAERKLQKALVNIQQNFDDFFRTMTRALHTYVHSPEFKRRILQGIDKCSRIMIGREMDSRIKKETHRWQQANVEEMFKREFIEKITEKFINIHQSLNTITNQVKGFTSPFDVKEKLASAVASYFSPNAPAITGSMVLANQALGTSRTMALAVGGLVFTGLKALDAMEDAQTVIKNAFRDRIEKMTVTEIERSLTDNYTDILNGIRRNIFHGVLKEEIDNLECNVSSVREKVHYFQKQESQMNFMNPEITEIKCRLKELENTDVQMD